MEKKERRLKAAIFDLDGVIVDTVKLHFQAWQRMFSEYGKSFNFQDYKAKVDGIPGIDGARAILNNLTEEELKQASLRKHNYFLEFLEEYGVDVYPEAIDLIKRFKAQALKAGVISSSKNCYSILEKAGITNLFDVVVGGSEVEKGKPDPEIFLLACKKLGFKPGQCVVFEDAVLGVEAGKSGGFLTVGIDRYQNPWRLDKADIVVSDLSRVNLDILEDLL
ncbi:MAG: beta-phosphoglucomutase family hydrolase [Candidatus Omnitrophica bacterium]|nr:beta-phosphoglucomutase family hydrolase [Candidatus Omnitrophota bacterium]